MSWCNFSNWIVYALYARRMVAEAVYKVDFRSGFVNREYILETFPL